MFAPRFNADPIDKYAGPYERWIFAPELGFDFAFPSIKQGEGAHYTALLEGRKALQSREGLDIRVPPIWSDASPVTPFAVHDQTEDQNVLPQDSKISNVLRDLGGQRYRVNQPIDPDTWTAKYDPSLVLNGWTPPPAPPRAIVAVVDDGIPFAHRAFRRADGTTRMSLCWLQAGRAPAAAAVPFGREITNREVNDWVEQHGSDERAFYRSSGAIDPTLPELGSVLDNRATHGGLVAGLAAGNDNHLGAQDLPDDVEVIAVQLPNTIAWDTSGIGKEMMMLSAIEYVCHRARAIAAYFNVSELPLAINFSYGWSANRHDGEASFEQGIQYLLSERKKVQPKTELIMPTGNNFLNRMHARYQAHDLIDGKINFGWQLHPADRTSSYLEAWLSKDIDASDWTVTVTPPKGTQLDKAATITFTPDPSQIGGDPRRFVEVELDGVNIGQLSVDRHQNNRWRVMLAMIPTQTAPNAKRRTPSGVWQIEISTGAGPLTGSQTVDIWVQRDDDPTQLGTGGLQSFLVDPTRITGAPQDPADAPLKPLRGYGCLNGIATAPDVLRVAGYVQSTGAAARYSGAGAILRAPDGTVSLDGQHPKVEAVADQGVMRPGLPSIGVTSGSYARIVGTSGAAALVTRYVAANFANGRDASFGMSAYPEDPDPVPLEVAKKRSRSGKYRVPPLFGPPSPA